MEFGNFLNEEKEKSPSLESTAHFQTMKRDVESLEDFEEITKDEPSLKDLTAEFLQFETTGKPEKSLLDEFNLQHDQFHLKREDKVESPENFSHEGLVQMPKEYDSQMEFIKDPNGMKIPVDDSNASNDLLSFEDAYSKSKSENIREQSTEEPNLNILDENKLSDVIPNDEISTGSDDLLFLPERIESSSRMHSDFEKNALKKPLSEPNSKESSDPLPKFTSESDLNSDKEPENWQGDGLHVKDYLEAEASDNDDIAPEPIPKDYPEITVTGGMEFLAAIGLDIWFQPHLLNPKVESLIYWRDPIKSGAVFGTVLCLLISLTIFNLITIVAHSGLLLLILTISWRLYKGVLQAVQKTSDGHPFKTYLDAVVNHPNITTVFFTIEEYLAFDLTLNPEKAREVTDVVISHVNKIVTKCRNLFLVEDVIDSFKFALFLWCLTYVGSWFNGLSLVIIGFVGLFTLPKIYENNKTQIDTNVELVKSKINDISEKIRAVIPLGKKPEEVKDKGE